MCVILLLTILSINTLYLPSQGSTSSIRLAGTGAMPAPPSAFRLDFSSLLGPLFLLWMLQLLGPVFVGRLVAEKEGGLGLAMRLAGASDG